MNLFRKFKTFSAFLNVFKDRGTIVEDIMTERQTWGVVSFFLVNMRGIEIIFVHENEILVIMSYGEMAHLELMNAAANISSQEDLDALRLTLSLFFAERAQKEIDKMWDDGSFDQKKLDELRGQHLRTPYRTF